MKVGKITTIGQLRETIRDLEHQSYVDEQHMRAKVTEMADRLKPINIVKNMLGAIFHGGSEAKQGLLKMAGGILTSLIIKKFFKKTLHRP